MTNYFDAAVRLGVWREYFSVTPAAEHDSGFPRPFRAPTPRLSRPTRDAPRRLRGQPLPVVALRALRGHGRDRRRRRRKLDARLRRSAIAVPVTLAPSRYMWRQNHGRTTQHAAALERAHEPVARAGLARAVADAAVRGRCAAVIAGAAAAAPATLVDVFAPEILRAERTVELLRTWFYHGRVELESSTRLQCARIRMF